MIGKKEKELHMNPLALPNVTLHHELDVQDKEKYGFDSPAMRTVIWETATRFPMWDIVITGVKMGNDQQLVSGIAIMSGREKLGTVKLEYVGRGYERKLSIQNKRIDQSLERARAMHTEDPKRAMAIIKKWFRNKTTAELVADGLGTAQTVYGSFRRSTHSKKMIVRETIQSMSFSFIMHNPEVRTELAKFIAAIDAGMHKKLVEAYNAHDEAESFEMALQSFDKGVHTIIAIDEGYIVCHNDTVSSYTDATLPDNLRAPLGMLKLVNAKELIKGVGFKADNNVFVVKPSEIE